MLGLIDPLLEEIGEKWQNKENVSFSSAYVAGKVAEYALNKHMDEYKEDNSNILRRKKYTIIVGNIFDDFHSLGRSILANYLRISGWNVIDLGLDVSSEHFIEEAIKHSPSVIAVSAMIYSTAMNIKDLIIKLNKLNLRKSVPVICGGAIFKFKPLLGKEIGCDATGKNAFEANRMIEELLVDYEFKTKST